MPPEQQLRTTCNRDCPDSCGILVTVKDGRVVEHVGDPEHGVTRGFLCHRGNHYLERFYSDERLRHPQRRTKSGWERIGWNDALDLVAERLAHHREQDGPLSALAVSYSGIKGLVTKLLWRKFWAHFGGATTTRGGLSVEAAQAAQVRDFGRAGTHAPDDLAYSKAIVIWGKNVAVTRVHAVPFIKEARARGAELLVIDPVCCATARMADHHLALRPGSDGMLAIGVARLLLEWGAIDEGFVAERCLGFAKYAEKIRSVELHEVCAATDLAREELERLAQVYAETKPLATLIGLGPAYWRDGGSTIRLIDALAAITGNLGVPGGGAQTDLDGGEGLDLTAFEDLPAAESRRLLLPRLGEEILAATYPPLRVGFVAGANPAATCPDTGRVREGLRSLEFLVVVDQFMTATAELADLVLPCTTYLEMEDLVCAYGHGWLSLCQEVVPPLGEARSDADIMRALAGRLGFGPALAGDSREWIERMLRPLDDPRLSYEELKQRAAVNPGLPRIPFADGRFDTSSGKCELVDDFDPRSHEPHPGQLRLMATKSLKMVNAQINPEDLAVEPVVRAHPATIAEEGLVDDRLIFVESEAGRVRARLRADESVRRDVLLFNPAAWQGDLQGVNQLRESTLADLGGAAAMHETLVRLSAAEATWPREHSED